MALGLVFNGQEIWIGNDDYETTPEARHGGTLGALREAIAEYPPVGRLPPGSQGIVVTFDTGARIRLPLGPIMNLTPNTAVGSEEDYRGHIGTDLVEGVSIAIDELSRADAARRIMVVVSDGNDTNIEMARTALPELAQRASAEHIEIHAIVWQSALSSDGIVIDKLTPRVEYAQLQDLPRAVSSVWRRVDVPSSAAPAISPL